MPGAALWLRVAGRLAEGREDGADGRAGGLTDPSPRHGGGACGARSEPLLTVLSLLPQMKETIMNQEKLAKLQAQVRIGGKVGAAPGRRWGGRAGHGHGWHSPTAAAAGNAALREGTANYSARLTAAVSTRLCLASAGDWGSLKSG